jgi:hypothetical protein
LDDKEKAPPIGTYETNLNTIEEIVKKRSETGAGGNPLIASLKGKH